VICRKHTHTHITQHAHAHAHAHRCVCAHVHTKQSTRSCRHTPKQWKPFGTAPSLSSYLTGLKRYPWSLEILLNISYCGDLCSFHERIALHYFSCAHLLCVFVTLHYSCCAIFLLCVSADMYLPVLQIFTSPQNSRQTPRLPRGTGLHQHAAVVDVSLVFPYCFSYDWSGKRAYVQRKAAEL